MRMQRRRLVCLFGRCGNGNAAMMMDDDGAPDARPFVASVFISLRRFFESLTTLTSIASAWPLEGNVANNQLLASCPWIVNIASTKPRPLETPFAGIEHFERVEFESSSTFDQQVALVMLEPIVFHGGRHRANVIQLCSNTLRHSPGSRITFCCFDTSDNAACFFSISFTRSTSAFSFLCVSFLFRVFFFLFFF